jgi:hypothetical protein
LKNVKDYVIRALESDEVCRTSDRHCIVYVWWLQNNNFDKNFKRLFLNKKLYHPETIRRVRQKIQEEDRKTGANKYQPPQEVDNHRFEQYIKVKQSAPVVSDANLIQGLPE